MLSTVLRCAIPCLIVAVLAIGAAIWVAPEANFVGLYLTWFLTFGAIWAATSIPPIGSLLSRAGAALAGQLSAAGAFHSDANREMPKFALLRIAFGALMLHRAVLLIAYAYPGDLTTPGVAVFFIANCAAALSVTLGLFTQVSLVFLVVVQWQLGDYALGTGTLGNDVAAILALLLMLANAGAHLSLDGWLMRRGPVRRLIFGAFYYRDGMPPDEVLQLAKLFALFSYWLVCLFSLSMHVNEPAWISGTAGPLLLSNNFMSRLSGEFSMMFAYAPLAVHLAGWSLWIMMLWYALIFPLVLIGGWLRQAVIVWGFLFFCLSAVVLQLGWLAAFEFVLWAALFWRHSFIDRKGSLAIAYDDRCNLCDRTVNFLLRADIFQKLQFKPLTQNGAFLKEHGIETRQALTDLYGIELNQTNAKYAGYDLYIALSRQILLLAPAYPVLVVGKWLRIGPAIYRWVADRRTKLFGVCELPSAKPAPHSSEYSLASTRSLSGKNPALAIYSHVTVAGLAFLLAMPVPYVQWSGVALPDRAGVVLQNLAAQAHMFGITPIDVFNASDLRMAENWFTLSAVSSDGNETLLPVFTEDGRRLEWNISDRIYFGGTLAWRRSFSDGPQCFINQSVDFIAQLISLYESRSSVDPTSYVYRQFYQPLVSAEGILSGAFVPQTVSQLCEFSIKYSDGELSIQPASADDVAL